MLKIVVALAGDEVCLAGSEYRVNRIVIASVLSEDSVGRHLEASSFCGVVPDGQAFVATPAPLSFDSRYFGAVALSTLTVVTPLWTY